MATRENLPKIVRDIQDVVSQLCQDFETSNEPITDDSPALHRLCAKLEFLFTTSLKEKSILGSRRSYWHWIFVCLKSTKGLGDGIRYVQGNKEVRTSKGKGRAFIRYCLVHQTLADSLQNCIMNAAVTAQHISTQSVITNQTHSSAILTALYDLNAVNFDLNAKGYDLDSGWPTFASKRRSTTMDKWSVGSHVGSFGSLTSASVVMTTPRTQGSTGSSGSHIVDQRIEELVLELNQSDMRLKEQHDVIAELESKAESVIKSSNEKEDILTRVISDLETKNRHLHVAMGNMSSEFQAREQHWSEKHTSLLKENGVCQSKNADLTSKVQQLEEDKRTLEDLVSQQMSNITSTFVSSATNARLTPAISTPLYESSNHDPKLEDTREKNRTLNNQLTNSQLLCSHLQSQLKESASDAEAVAKLSVEVKDLQRQLSDTKVHLQMFADDVKQALALDPQEPNELHAIVKSILSLREQCERNESDLPGEDNHDEDINVISDSLKEENEYLMYDRDEAQHQADKHKTKVKEMEMQVLQLKVELESVRDASSQRIAELEEQISLTIQEKENQYRHYQEMLVDLKVTQEALKQTENDLQASRQQFQEFKQKESELEDEFVKVKELYDKEICKNEGCLQDIQNLQEANTYLATRENELVHLQEEMKRLKEGEVSHLRQLNFVSGEMEGFFEHMRLIKESEDLDKVRLEEKSFDSLAHDRNGFAKWKKAQDNFFDILRDYKTTKGELATLQTDHASLVQEANSYKSASEEEAGDFRDKLSELRSANDVHLITIKELRDKLQILQDAKVSHLDEISKLQSEVNNMTKSSEEDAKLADELRLRIMVDASKRQELEDELKMQQSDIESLKNKITQLLLDKDSLWKEKEELRYRVSDLRHGDLKKPDWTPNGDVSNCAACDALINSTMRRQQCRDCGKIFCHNCVSNWKEESNEKTRLCDSCFNDSTLNMSSVSMDGTIAWGTPQCASPSSKISTKEDEEALKDEPDVSNDALKEDEGASSFNSESAESDEKITVPARKEVHLPVLIEHPGITLHWEISSDRDINFKLLYAPTEDDIPQDIVPARKINSHIEPFCGDLVAKKEGVYTLVLDNTYSRITPKQVHYSLHTS